MFGVLERARRPVCLEQSESEVEGEGVRYLIGSQTTQVWLPSAIKRTLDWEDFGRIKVGF